ncbi:uncharacterized protein I303_103907 [Kwoniella dejecticola CBS 10117]|uniref:WSC domain-containing protein n=1 Tax=Kwoniella dejecticola CBS 10117 TaxID=1296121 RepID=A0A1A6A829_9TREE|nr:uncharacterized protein I303_03925 [Kwoniella dejecticola CBS 10117]OBR86205.1 hypothetical protein I303_03925 [Kwoniella dejecticola CBS 10117]
MLQHIIFTYVFGAIIAVADPLYVGCFDREAVEQSVPGVYLYQGENLPSVPCDCGAIGYKYSHEYGVAGGVGFYTTCFCTNVTPDFQYYLDVNHCDFGMTDYGDAFVSAESPATVGWSTNHCYRPSTPVTGIPVTDVFQCLTHCKTLGLKYAAMIPHQDSSTATCDCYGTTTRWADEPWTYCTWDDWRICTYTVQPSSRARRRLARKAILIRKPFLDQQPAGAMQYHQSTSMSSNSKHPVHILQTPLKGYFESAFVVPSSRAAIYHHQPTMYRSSQTYFAYCLLAARLILGNYVGCFSQDVLGGQPLQDITGSGLECQTVCYQQNKIYSYGYQEHSGQANYKSWCFCTDNPPEPNYMVADCGSSGDLTVIVPYQFAYQFVWYNCHSFVPTTPGTAVGSARDCWALCNPYSWAGVIYDQADPQQITCRCYQYDNHPWYGTPATACLPGAWFIYNHYPQPSGAVKRHHNRKLAGSTEAPLCPFGMTACPIPRGADGSYECVDTLIELEDCGGCTSVIEGGDSLTSSGVE